MWKKKVGDSSDRLRWVAIFFLGVALWIVAHLFSLQVLEHDYYSLFAFNSHEIYKKLHPERGLVYFQDSRNDELYPAALNRPYYLIYAVPKEIEEKKEDPLTIAKQLIEILAIGDKDKKEELEKRLSKKNSSYQVIERKVEEEQVEKIKSLKLTGIYTVPVEFRYYPEAALGAPVLGFVAKNDQGSDVGKYGIEGYWNKQLSRKAGFLSGERSALGSWITLAGRKITPSEDGAHVVLTIDRTLQYYACKRLQEGLEQYKAKSASLVMMDPKTGAVLAMCSLPDFDPNNFSKVPRLENFNNSTIFNAYEPGSVFKPVTMAIGIDLGLVGPYTTFVADPCKFEPGKGAEPIRNAERACYPGAVTMTRVLEKSINTGMTWLVDKIGQEKFKTYVEKFGFGKKTGVTLDTEVEGSIGSLKQKINMYYSSFGQSITVTPLQLAVAYSALANEGKLPHPYVIKEIRYANGKTEYTTPEIVDTVISSRSAKLITGMLVSTVDSYKEGKLVHYYVAGKTGTAQIFEHNKIKEETNHTMAGFAPADNPQVVLVIRYEEPNQKWAGSTVGPVFSDIMKSVLKYYAIPEER